MIWLSVQTVAQVSAERILNALPEGLLVAFFAWALLRLLRRQNAGTRFAVWFLALLTIAALPLIGGFGEEQVRGLLSSVTSSATAWSSLRPAVTIPGHWGFFVFAAWALGASVGLLRLALGLWQLRQLRRSCTEVDVAGLDPVLRPTIAAISASRSVTVCTSESVRVPAAIGFWKRTIVLPAWALRELPAEDLNVILLHEFAHLRRSDEWTNLIQKIVRSLFFFHPAVWWIEKQLSVEREMACDDAVLAETANPRGYATCLVSLLEKSLAHRLADKHLANQRWSMVQAAINRAHEASLRLAQILDSNRPKATRVWKPALGMVATFSLVCLVALPHAPQFVAFDRGTLGGSSTHQYAASSSQASEPALRAASAIPAAFRTDESSAPATMAKIIAAPVRAHAFSDHQFAAIPTTAPLIPEPLLDRPIVINDGASVIETSANTGAENDPETMPQFQTLVFVQATAYEINDAPVWRVQVWRVTLVNASFDRMARVPVVNKT